MNYLNKIYIDDIKIIKITSVGTRYMNYLIYYKSSKYTIEGINTIGWVTNSLKKSREASPLENLIYAYYFENYGKNI